MWGGVACRAVGGAAEVWGQQAGCKRHTALQNQKEDGVQPGCRWLVSPPMEETYLLLLVYKDPLFPSVPSPLPFPNTQNPPQPAHQHNFAHRRAPKWTGFPSRFHGQEWLPSVVPSARPPGRAGWLQCRASDRRVCHSVLWASRSSLWHSLIPLDTGRQCLLLSGSVSISGQGPFICH